LEGVEEATPAVNALIEELKGLQDTLGELHDSQLFGGELATMIAEQLADEGERGKARDNGGASSGRAKKPTPVAGLRILSHRMRHAEAKAFKTYASAWAPEATAGFIARIRSLTDELRAIALGTAPTTADQNKTTGEKKPAAKKKPARRTKPAPKKKPTR